MNSLVSINSISYTPSFCYHLKENESHSQIFKVASETFKQFDHFWTYAGKGSMIVRHLLNSTMQSCRFFTVGCQNFNRELTKVVIKLQLLAIVSIPLNVISLVGQTKKITRCIALNDYKGFALGALGSSLIFTDIIDSAITFVNALMIVLSKSSIEWLSGYGMPLAFSMIAQGTILRSVRLKNLKLFMKDFKNVTHAEKKFEEVRADLKRFLEVRLGKRDSHLRELEETTLERHTNLKVVSLLKELDSLVDHNNLKKEDLLQQKAKIFVSLEKDVTLQKIYLTANLLNATALLLFYTTIPLSVPFAVLATGFTVRLMGQGYQDFSS